MLADANAMTPLPARPVIRAARIYRVCDLVARMSRHGRVCLTFSRNKAGCGVLFRGESIGVGR